MSCLLCLTNLSYSFCVIVTVCCFCVLIIRTSMLYVFICVMCVLLIVYVYCLYCL